MVSKKSLIVIIAKKCISVKILKKVILERHHNEKKCHDTAAQIFFLQILVRPESAKLLKFSRIRENQHYGETIHELNDLGTLVVQVPLRP